MKVLLIYTLLVFFGTAASGQEPSKKTDSIARKVIGFLRAKQPDSVYMLTGKAFRDKITAENFSSITTTKIFPLTDFKTVKYISTTQNINKYRVEGTPALQLLVGLDADDKINTLLIQEFIPE
jgi:hypothetical protein